MPSMQQRAWKPNLLIPIEDIRKLRGSLSMIEHITYPKGSAKLLGIGNQSPAFSERNCQILGLQSAAAYLCGVPINRPRRAYPDYIV